MSDKSSDFDHKYDEEPAETNSVASAPSILKHQPNAHLPTPLDAVTTTTTNASNLPNSDAARGVGHVDDRNGTAPPMSRPSSGEHVGRVLSSAVSHVAHQLADIRREFIHQLHHHGPSSSNSSNSSSKPTLKKQTSSNRSNVSSKENSQRNLGNLCARVCDPLSI